jgi:NhaP-type Na+/H+ or K+/H+ antiporter
VLWLVLREALTLVVIGLVIGVVASLLMTKTAESFYELKPNDPLTITLATLLLAAVAAFAGKATKSHIKVLKAQICFKIYDIAFEVY